MKATTPQSFWAKVDIRNKNDCWLWQGSFEKHGYGRTSWKCKMYLSHRIVAWLEGLIPSLEYDKHVCHHCDNPPCCNPKHLFVGTNTDNVLDKVKKDRQYKGTDVHTSKLTREQVTEARNKYFAGTNINRLANEYKVVYSTMKKLVTNQTWKSIK